PLLGRIGPISSVAHAWVAPQPVTERHGHFILGRGIPCGCPRRPEPGHPQGMPPRKLPPRAENEMTLTERCSPLTVRGALRMLWGNGSGFDCGKVPTV